MSVRPVAFNPDGSIETVYDEAGHSGTIPAAEVRWTTNLDGSPNHSYIVLQCPDGCGASSTHPVGGGADAPNVQQMFVRKVEREGCVCPPLRARGAVPLSDAAAHVKQLVTEMDGADRWVLDEAVLAAIA